MKASSWLSHCLLTLALCTFSLPFCAAFDSNHQGLATAQLSIMRPDCLDSDWHLNEYFGSIVIINLPEKKDHLQFVATQLKSVGAKNFEVFHAIDGRNSVDPVLWKKMDWNWAGYDLKTEEGRKRFDHHRQGEMGCYLSHLSVLKKIKEGYDQALKDLQEAKKKNDIALQKKANRDLNQFRNVLILEDDNGFGIVSPDAKSATLSSTGTIFRLAMKDLPTQWDMLYLMTYYAPQLRIINFLHLAKVCGGYTTNAYAVNHTMYAPLIAALSKVFDPQVKHIFPIDNVYASLHQRYNCYAIIPSIAYQKAGLSSITSANAPNLLQSQPLTVLITKHNHD